MTTSQADVDEFRGLYQEELGKIVDGIECEIEDGNITSPDEAKDWLADAVSASQWVDEEPWQIHTLLYGKYPCMGLVDWDEVPWWMRNPFKPEVVDGVETMGHPPFEPEDPFPMKDFAYVTMRCEAMDLLAERQAYKDLCKHALD